MTQVVGKGSCREIETGVEVASRPVWSLCAHDDCGSKSASVPAREGAWCPQIMLPAHATGVAGPAPRLR